MAKFIARLRHRVSVIAVARATGLFDRQRIGRRSYRAGDRDGGCDEHELVYLVRGAIVGEILEIENLAHGHAHDRDGDPMPGLVDAGFGVVGPYLAAPGIAG